MGFVFIISSLVILHSDDYMFGDLNIIRFILLVLIFVVFIISSLVILYSDDYMFGDLNIIRFILLVLMFVVFIIVLIVSPNVISILLG